MNDCRNFLRLEDRPLLQSTRKEKHLWQNITELSLKRWIKQNEEVSLMVRCCLRTLRARLTDGLLLSPGASCKVTWCSLLPPGAS